MHLLRTSWNGASDSGLCKSAWTRAKTSTAQVLVWCLAVVIELPGDSRKTVALDQSGA